MSLLVMFFGFWSCLVYFENCEIFEIKVRDEFTLKRNSYTYIYIYIFTASVVKRATMLINSIGSSWEGFGWTIGTILVLIGTLVACREVLPRQNFPVPIGH